MIRPIRKKSVPPADKRPWRVFIVDDHPLIRIGLKELIAPLADLTFCGQASDAKAALARLPKSGADLAVIDLSLSGLSGLDLIKMLRKTEPRLRLLVLSIHDESIYAERALKAGADGYIMKEEKPAAVITAIRRIRRGGIFVSEAVNLKLLRKAAGREADRGPAGDLASLSDRELEVFERIGRGLSTHRIADAMSISAKTVETHRINLKKKLQVQDTAELMRHALEYVRGN